MPNAGFIFAFVSILLIQSGDCRGNQKRLCRPGQGISTVTFSQDASLYRTYRVGCAAATTSCKEKCQWTTACIVDTFGAYAYVRGINVVYDPATESQSMIFYCCNGTGSVVQQTCDPTIEVIGKPRTNNKVLRQAHSKIYKSKSVSIVGEFCYRQITSACPQEPMVSSDTTVYANPYYYNRRRERINPRGRNKVVEGCGLINSLVHGCQRFVRRYRG